MDMNDEKKEEEQARAVLLRERENRVKRCQDRINKILEEENCAMYVAMLVTPEGNRPQLTVISKD
jgi:hypothetical protein